MWICKRGIAVADLASQDMAAKLLADSIGRDGPQATVLSDPLIDTPMQVTLDELRPYTNDPRIRRNPAYEEIKASIRERGLDAPPAITRRPGDAHYLIRSGGNTRLAILRELWMQTQDTRFFRISCLFRPWPARGDVVILTGHLAENALRGNLTYIERALAIEKARAFYEQEEGAVLSQSELARRLTADGYPARQPHISGMQDAVRYLLPVIPTVLYGGLGRHQVERLVYLRRACERTWQRHGKGRGLDLDFATVFRDILAPFDTQGEGFSLQRVLDELVGQMAEQLGLHYDTLLMEVDEGEALQRAVSNERVPVDTSEPKTVPVLPIPFPIAVPIKEKGTEEGQGNAVDTSSATEPVPAIDTTAARTTPFNRGSDARRPLSDDAQASAGQVFSPDVLDQAVRLRGHIVSPAPTTERLQSIQRMVADSLGDAVPDFEANVLRAIPVQVGGLYPISDVWYIEPGLDDPARLRVHIVQFAREIAQEAGIEDRIDGCEGGIGFRCQVVDSLAQNPSASAKAILFLLASVSMDLSQLEPSHRVWLALALAPLLLGQGVEQQPLAQLSDAGLVKFFRLLRLARRLIELENHGISPEISA